MPKLVETPEEIKAVLRSLDSVAVDVMAKWLDNLDLIKSGAGQQGCTDEDLAAVLNALLALRERVEKMTDVVDRLLPGADGDAPREVVDALIRRAQRQARGVAKE